MKRKNLEDVLGALEDVARGLDRAAHEPPERGMVTLLNTAGRVLDLAANATRHQNPSTPPVKVAQPVVEQFIRAHHQTTLRREPTAQFMESWTRRAMSFVDSGMPWPQLQQVLVIEMARSPDFQPQQAQPPPPPPPPPTTPTTPPQPENPPPPRADGRRLNIRKR